MVKQVFLFLGLFLVMSYSVKSQGDSIMLCSVSLIGGFGNVFKTNTMIEGDTEFGIPIIYSSRRGVKFQKTLTTKAWHSSFNNPQIGIQVFQTKFRNGEYQFQESLGEPIIIAGVFQAPFTSSKKLYFGYNLGLGAAIGWKPYVDNLFNISIGSKTSFYIELGLNVKKSLTKYIDLGLNLGVTHYSNGAAKLPNFGINIGNAFLNLDYKLGKIKEIKEISFSEILIKKTKVDLSFFMSSKSTLIKVDSLNNNKLIVKSYPVFGISGIVSKPLNRKNKLGIGLSLTHNPTNGVVNYQQKIEEENPGSIIDVSESYVSESWKENILMSTYLAYELQVGQVSVLVQPSFYLYRGVKLDYIPNFYQRLGIRYNTKRKAFVGFNLRAYSFHVSDFIEWNIGYSF